NSVLLEAAERLKIGLLAKATNGEYPDADFREDLKVLSSDNRLNMMLPSYIRLSRSSSDFRRAMQAKFEGYAERRNFIDQELEPIFQYLEIKSSDIDKFELNIDAYELGEQLGNGGFGVVYKYHHKLLGIDFAIKIFEPVFVSNDENIEGEKRFFREAKMLFQLNSDYIVRVYDIGRIDGKPFIRMELVEGYTLQDFISQNGTVSFTRSIKPITALLNGLNYAHKMGVIHRDLKPSNVMVTKDGKFKIIDFGISAFLENENHTKLTKTGENVAGGQYTDPVLMINPKLRDMRSDLYSVGAIWYYLLMGRSPAGGDARRILLTSGNATELQSEIIFKCLTSDPSDRYQSCEEILAILHPPERINNSQITVMTPNRITEITREAIFDYLSERYYDECNAYIFSQSGGFKEPERVFYYYGRRNCVTFLNRLYDLKSMPTGDSRLKTFEEEILRHTVVNEDYEYNWVFHDERFGLEAGNDEVLLKFLCEMFHPLVRSEKSDWQSVKESVNELLKMDGYEIYEIEKISGRSVYSYRYCV
ncbi:protein kinase domain-containing protein, partial [Paenibacillus antibioticophila]|uniref:protein kinase domain-containing protein n=1 Tax=Paenibacillus antibioticophila TaxID=1274374 RepID=UPI0005CA80D7